MLMGRERFAEGGLHPMGLPHLSRLTTSPADERRRSMRMPLRLTATLIRRNGGTLSTVTENLSSSGFYCRAKDRLAPGEEFDCSIALSPDYARSLERQFLLLCCGRVARVEPVDADWFGLGCTINEYFVFSQ